MHIRIMHKRIQNTLTRLITGLRQHLFALIVLVPMIILSVYYLLVATDFYLSESKVVVKRNSDALANLGGISIPLLGALGGTSNEDALYLKEFIYSADLLDQLEIQLDLRNEFLLKGIDVVSMLPPWATREDFVKHYRERVDVLHDDKSGVLTIRTIGSYPEYSQKFNQAILKESERFVNELSQRIAREQAEFAAQELMRARKSLDNARDNLLAFQNRHGMLDPSISAAVTNRVISELEAQLAAKQVEMRSLGGTLQGEAPQMITLRRSIESLKAQIATEGARLTSTQGGSLNRVAADYLDKKAVFDFQADVYRVTLAAHEKMRVEAARKVKSLIVISKPQLPEEVGYPRRSYMLTMWFFCLCMLYGFVRLAVEIVEDHRD